MEDIYIYIGEKMASKDGVGRKQAKEMEKRH